MKMRTDVFGLAPRQQDMFGEPQGIFDTMMSDDEIRTELQEVIDLLSASNAIPWETRQMIQISNMFPEIAGRLPCAEAARFTGEFDHHMNRLRTIAA